MKKTISTAAALIALTFFAGAQNVGIGTPAPEEKLHIVDTVDVADGSNGALINLQNATLFSPVGTISGIRFRLDGVTSGLNSRFKGGILFEKTSSFGVGKLHFVTNNQGNNNSITTADARMTIAADGKVGIGNSSPSLGQLEINGPTTTSQIITRNSPGGAGISHAVSSGLYPTLGFNMYYNSGFRFMDQGYGAIIQYSPITGTMFFSTTQTTGAQDALGFFNANSVAIDSNGYLGIGTTAPKARLHVASSMVVGSSTTVPATGYLLSVNGKIMAEEVRVQLDADWPDYVFDKNYRLRPLTELEQFITANKHLPGIPSAGQVATEGLMVGDMQKRVMEKVEELTLYILQLNKENQELRKEIADLRKLAEQK